MENNVFQLNPTYKQVSQPETSWMPIEDFLDLKPVFCQRQTEYRMSKIKKLLKARFFQSHLDVAVFKYPCGKMVRGNGNTRAECWKAFIDEDELGLVPENVNAVIYNVEDDEEAKKLYYTFDSDDSVEKNPDKITGVYRALGIHGRFNLPKIAKGGIAKSLQYASLNRSCNPASVRDLNWFEIINDFKEELLALDGLSPKPIFDSHIICASLMMFKRYGVNNKRLLEGLGTLNASIKGPQHPKYGTDGITAILEEWSVDKYFEIKATDGISFPRQQDFLLYCFEKWMKNQNVTTYKRPSEGKPGKGKRQSLYDAFWENDEE